MGISGGMTLAGFQFSGPSGVDIGLIDVIGDHLR
jgi:hypothetical protein